MERAQAPDAVAQQPASAGEAAEAAFNDAAPRLHGEALRIRQSSGDPPLSLAERYPTPAAYAQAVRMSAGRLVADRLLLPEDAEAMAAAAEAGRPAR